MWGAPGVPVARLVPDERQPQRKSGGWAAGAPVQALREGACGCRRNHFPRDHGAGASPEHLRTTGRAAHAAPRASPSSHPQGAAAPRGFTQRL